MQELELLIIAAWIRAPTTPLWACSATPTEDPAHRIFIFLSDILYSQLDIFGIYGFPCRLRFTHEWTEAVRMSILADCRNMVYFVF